MELKSGVGDPRGEEAGRHTDGGGVSRYVLEDDSVGPDLGPLADGYRADDLGAGTEVGMGSITWARRHRPRGDRRSRTG